jgi:hypothetical protein
MSARRTIASKHRMKMQSAMEYLMTYGWAILIIAVVLGALFQLGVFSSSSFSVRAPPGACQVLRTTAGVSLVGQCSGAIPQYVAQFNGQNSYVNAGLGASIKIDSKSFTLSAWVKPISHIAIDGSRFTVLATYTPGWLMDLVRDSGSEGYRFYDGSNPLAYYPPGNFFPLSWTHFVITRNIGSTVLIIYLNGVAVLTTSTGSVASSSNPVLIGKRSDGYSFNGQIANIQMYNASLAAGDVQSLYAEGIGGVPMYPANLVAWWPLNGDLKDYSGNNNYGSPTSISYTDQWLSGYR